MPVLFYDDECGLCDGAVRFFLSRDTRGALHYASLSSPFAQRELAARGLDSNVRDTVYLLTDDGEILSRSSAALLALRSLGGGWWAVACMVQVIPRPLRDAIYMLVSRNRIRWFGRPTTCVAPTPEQRARFRSA